MKEKDNMKSLDRGILNVGEFRRDKCMRSGIQISYYLHNYYARVSRLTLNAILSFSLSFSLSLSQFGNMKVYLPVISM